MPPTKPMRDDIDDPPTRQSSPGARATERWRPAPGDWIDTTYRLGPILGEGGLGIVFRAEDVGLARDVAIKFLHPDRAAPALAQRLLDEARTMASIEHPRLVTAYASGWHRGAPFVVMELVEGKSALAHLRDRHGLLPLAEVTHIVAAVAEGLDWLHAAGLEHGDVKPANVVLGARGGVRLVDGGVRAEHARGGLFEGTPAYAAPERLGLGPKTHSGRASDIYSLAVLAFELFTGTLPFLRRGAPDATDASRAALPPDASSRRADLPRGLDRVLAHGLAPDPLERPHSAGAFVGAIRDVSSSLRPLPFSTPRSGVPTGRRILLIDADTASATVIAQGLAVGFARCVVETVSDSRAAVAAASLHRPDAIIVDVVGRADLDLVRRLRAIPGCSSVAIVATTANGGAAEWRVLREAGVLGCYLKPLVVEELVGALSRAWRPGHPPIGDLW